ncbi:MAG: antitoxin family protein [Oscillatoria princeps RMCB-10]|nr:antitoxin family protein [Oscillatoria princeps RMCB-10]
MTQTQTIEAIYENGVLRPLQALPGLPENSKVKITIECEPAAQHPLQEFAGILSDEEASDLQRTIADEFEKIDSNGW